MTHEPTDTRSRRRPVLERATAREILMGAQDNLTNVLAVVLGATIGAERAAKRRRGSVRPARRW